MSRSGKVWRPFECFVYNADFPVPTHCCKGRENSNLFKLLECDQVTHKISPLHFTCDVNESMSQNKHYLKFMFSKKATKIDKIFTLDLTICSKCQIDSEYFVNFCGLLRKHEL